MSPRACSAASASVDWATAAPIGWGSALRPRQAGSCSGPGTARCGGVAGDAGNGDPRQVGGELRERQQVVVQRLHRLGRSTVARAGDAAQQGRARIAGAILPTSPTAVPGAAPGQSAGQCPARGSSGTAAGAGYRRVGAQRRGRTVACLQLALEPLQLTSASRRAQRPTVPFFNTTARFRAARSRPTPRSSLAANLAAGDREVRPAPIFQDRAEALEVRLRPGRHRGAGGPCRSRTPAAATPRYGAAPGPGARSGAASRRAGRDGRPGRPAVRSRSR